MILPLRAKPIWAPVHKDENFVFKDRKKGLMYHNLHINTEDVWNNSSRYFFSFELCFFPRIRHFLNKSARDSFKSHSKDCSSNVCRFISMNMFLHFSVDYLDFFFPNIALCVPPSLLNKHNHAILPRKKNAYRIQLWIRSVILAKVF